MYIQKIFVAGSKKLTHERDLFRIVASEIQSECCKRGYDVNLQVVTFETFDYCFTPQRKQQAYNEYILKEADVCYFILDGNVGGITEEEFDIAFESYKNNERPMLCVFSCSRDTEDDTIKQIRHKISEAGQYYTEYFDEKDLKVLIEKSLRHIIEPIGVKSKSTNRKIGYIGKLLTGLLLMLASVFVGFYLYDYSVKNDSEELSLSRTISCKVNDIVFNMIRVPAGSFIMGGYDSDAELHPVTISNDFLIGETEVTQDLWNSIMTDNPSKTIGEDIPVNNVSWRDCLKFLEKLNKLTGEYYRLPTEAEWEYAAKFGSDKYVYCGNDLPDSVAWYIGNSDHSIHNVKLKLPNELGIYDMSGNVWEWCSDYYGDYNINDSLDPLGARYGNKRVRRGGSYLDNSRCCQITFRSRQGEDVRRPGHGFRLVKEITGITK